MDKKKILLLVGGVAVIVIVAVVTQYIAMRQTPTDTNTSAEIEHPQILTPDFVPVALPDDVRSALPPATADRPLPTETPSSFGGKVTAVNGDNITIMKADGATVDYPLKTFVGIYDNRTEGTIKPLKKQDITVGMAVRVLYTLNQADKTDVIDLMVYEK